MESTLPFSIVCAFTSDPFAGNPAAVIFANPSAPSELLANLGKNFNQPMTAVVSSTPMPSDASDVDPKVETRAIRYIAFNGKDVPICGHATIAASKVIFDLPEVVEKGVTTIKYMTFSGHSLTAFKLDDGFFEIQLPDASPQDVSEEEKERMTIAVDAAFGRHVKINNIQKGGSKYEIYALIEIDESEDLSGSIVTPNAFLGNGFIINIVTSTSPDPKDAFVSRMFSPAMLVGGEDPVCGSAHSLLAPYWYSKQGITPGEEVNARQVSPRGGRLKVVWDPEQGIIRLRGQCAVFASGDIRT